MPHVNLKTGFKLRSNLLTIRQKLSFAKTLKQIKIKSPDYIFIKIPNTNQMTAALLWRLSGKNFVWIQGFANPPAPSIVTRLLLAQADKIVIRNKKDITKLTDFGIKKSKIRILGQIQNYPRS